MAGNSVLSITMEITKFYDRRQRPGYNPVTVPAGPPGAVIDWSSSGIAFHTVIVYDIMAGEHALHSSKYVLVAKTLVR